MRKNNFFMFRRLKKQWYMLSLYVPPLQATPEWELIQNNNICLSIWVKTIIATELVVGNEATRDNKKNRPKSFVLKKKLNKKKVLGFFHISGN